MGPTQLAGYMENGLRKTTPPTTSMKLANEGRHAMRYTGAKLATIWKKLYIIVAYDRTFFSSRAHFRTSSPGAAAPAASSRGCGGSAPASYGAAGAPCWCASHEQSPQQQQHATPARRASPSVTPMTGPRYSRSAHDLQPSTVG